MRSKGELGIRAMHKSYLLNVKDGSPLSVYLPLLEEFNKRVSILLLDGHLVKLPFNLGELAVEKKKVNFNHLKLDYGHWRKTGGEKVYHTNRHSDGYHAFFAWKKVLCSFAHKGLFKFHPCRSNSRNLASLMKKEDGHGLYPAYVPPTDSLY